MSGIIGQSGSKSTIIGSDGRIGATCKASLTTGMGTVATGPTYLTGYTQRLNDDASIFSVGTNGITITVSGTYIIDMTMYYDSITVDTSWIQLRLASNANTSYGMMNYNLQAIKTDNGDYNQWNTSNVYNLTAGKAYGLYQDHNSGTIYINANSGLTDNWYTGIALTLLRSGVSPSGNSI